MKQRTRMRAPVRILAFAVLALVLLAPATARAGLIIATGTSSLGNEEGLVFLASGPALTIPAQTNVSGAAVALGSVESLLAASGAVSAEDGSLNNLTFWLPGDTFTRLLLNIYAVASGTVMLSILEPGGSNLTGTFSFAPGNNPFTLWSTDGQVIEAVQISTASGAASINNFGVAGMAATQVPEPASLTLFAIGLIGLARWRRRRG